MSWRLYSFCNSLKVEQNGWRYSKSEVDIYILFASKCKVSVKFCTIRLLHNLQHERTVWEKKDQSFQK